MSGKEMSMRGYFNCKFCKGRGCLACEGEREKDRVKDEKAMQQSFNNPLLVIKGTPDEDPVGWEILQGLNAKTVEENYKEYSDNPALAGLVLELKFLLRKDYILTREAQADLETSISRFESEGGPSAA
jgi:hypothetical protein